MWGAFALALHMCPLSTFMLALNVSGMVFALMSMRVWMAVVGVAIRVDRFQVWYVEGKTGHMVS
jgi:hypothetical protein